MALVAIPLLVLRFADAPWQIGVAVASAGLGAFIGSVAGSPLVDRNAWLAGVGSATAGAGLTMLIPLVVWSGVANLYAIMAISFASSVVSAPGFTARHHMVESVAGRSTTSVDRLSAGLWLVQRIGLILGGPLAAVVIGVTDVVFLFVVDAICFILAAGMLVPVGATIQKPSGAVSNSYFADLKEGLSSGLREPIVRLLLLASFVVGALAASVLSVLMPVRIQAAGADEELLAWLAAAMGVGAVVGGLLSWLLAERLRLDLAAGGGLVLLGGGQVMLAAGFELSLLLTGMAVIGAGAALLAPTTTRIVRQYVDYHLRGRVIGAVVATNVSSVPVGESLTGVTLGFVDARLLLVLFGMSVVVLAVPLTARLRPRR